MGQLVWRYGSDAEFLSESAGFRLTAGRAQLGHGYRYAVLARDEALGATPLASGSRESLREAIEAAEHALGTIDPKLALAS